MKTKKQLARCPGMARGLRRRLNKMIKHDMVLMMFASRDALLQILSVTLVMDNDDDAGYISGKLWFQYADERYNVFMNIIKHDHFTDCNEALPLMFLYTNCSKKQLLYTKIPACWDECFKPYAERFKTGHTRRMLYMFEDRARLYENIFAQYLLPLLNEEEVEVSAILHMMGQLLKDALTVLQKVLFHSYDVLFTENSDVVLDFAFRYGSFFQGFFAEEEQAVVCKRLQRVLKGNRDHYAGSTYKGDDSLEKRAQSLHLFLQMTYRGIPERYVQQLKKVQQRPYKKSISCKGQATTQRNDCSV